MRALAEQQGAIESFRTRAGLLLSAAAITTSFLGAQALDGGHSNAVPGVFVSVAVASLGVLWPRRWEFTASPRDVIQINVEADEPASIEGPWRSSSGSWPSHPPQGQVANPKVIQGGSQPAARAS